MTARSAVARCGEGLRFLSARAPTPQRMTAALAQVHKAIAADTDAEDDDDALDLDPALAACVQLALAGWRWPVSDLQVIAGWYQDV
ncbi:MAG: hypothetical protein IPK80_03340 [Nannocystis sp.]|nr:hypothetical protein [Nannocystis sp.]